MLLLGKLPDAAILLAPDVCTLIGKMGQYFCAARVQNIAMVYEACRGLEDIAIYPMLPLIRGAVSSNNRL